MLFQVRLVVQVVDREEGWHLEMKGNYILESVMLQGKTLSLSILLNTKGKYMIKSFGEVINGMPWSIEEILMKRKVLLNSLESY